jgi:cytosine/adenosine deaminase-related metal-dependent hydrolase
LLLTAANKREYFSFSIMTLLIWAGIALPDFESPPQSDFAVCVEENRIVAAGPRSSLQARFPNAATFGAANLLLMPALVNSHDHGRALGSASLGVPDDLLEIWLPQLAAIPNIDPYLAAAYESIQLLKSGVATTTHSHNPSNWQDLAAESAATLDGYRDAGLRVAFHPPVVDQNFLVYDEAERFMASLPASVAKIARPFLHPDVPGPDDYFGMCHTLFETYHDPEQHTIHLQVSPAGGQWCSDSLIAAAVDFARQHNTIVQMHMLETRYQQQYAYRKWGKSFIQHLEDQNLLGPWLTLAHMVWVEPDDLLLLADRDVGIVHNPSSNLRLRSGIAPLGGFVRAGLRTGIGLDGLSLDDDQDYFREMRLAWILSQQPGGGAGAPVVPADLIWKMGTVDGASVTLGSQVALGRLAAGYLADLVLVDWQAVRGLFDPPPEYMPSLLLHRATRCHVKQVMVNGRWVVKDGQCITLDEAGITATLKASLSRDRQENPQQLELLVPYLRRFYAQWD